MLTKEKTPCVVLLSGGLDSAVALSQAIIDGFEPHVLTVDYGQRHRVEIEAARNVCSHFQVREHKILNLNLRAFGGSALTTEQPVPKGERQVDDPVIPLTYVPARNLIFLSLGISWAESLGAFDVYVGVSAVDYSGYPDCRASFIRSFEQTANLGTRAVEGGPKFVIHTPLIGLSKAETVKLGLRNGVDFSLTWTCYDPSPDGKPCGDCESCLLRNKGFKEAGMVDPVRGGH